MSPASASLTVLHAVRTGRHVTPYTIARATGLTWGEVWDTLRRGEAAGRLRYREGAAGERGWEPVMPC